MYAQVARRDTFAVRHEHGVFSPALDSSYEKQYARVPVR